MRRVGRGSGLASRPVLEEINWYEELVVLVKVIRCQSSIQSVQNEHQKVILS